MVFSAFIEESQKVSRKTTHPSGSGNLLSFILVGILTASECFKLRKAFKGLTNEKRPNFDKNLFSQELNFPV